MLDLLAKHVLQWRYAHGLPETADEIRLRQAGAVGQFLYTDGAGYVLPDKLQYAKEPFVDGLLAHMGALHEVGE